MPDDNPNVPPVAPVVPAVPPVDLNYNKDVAGNSLENILDEKATQLAANQNTPTPGTPDPNVPPVQTTPPENTPPATPTPTPAPQTPATSTPVEDAAALKEKLKGELKEEISNETAAKIAEFLGADTKDDNKPPWEKENRLPSYEEAIDWSVKQAEPALIEKVAAKVKEDLNKEVEDEEAKDKAAKEEADKLEVARTTQWTNYWNSQFSELETRGIIPKVNEADNRKETVTVNGVETQMPLDPGKRMRLEIFQTMQRVTAENEKAGKPPIMSVVDAFFMHHKPGNTQPPGVDAPIFTGNKSVGNSNTGSFTYQEVKEAKIENILQELQSQRTARG